MVERIDVAVETSIEIVVVLGDVTRVIGVDVEIIFTLSVDNDDVAVEVDPIDLVLLVVAREWAASAVE